MPIEVDYKVLVPELYGSLVKGFSKRDKNLNVLTMCRSYDLGIRGRHKNADKTSTDISMGGLSSMLQLLMLKLANPGNAEQTPKPYAKESSSKKGKYNSWSNVRAR